MLQLLSRPTVYGGLLQQKSGTAVEPCVVEATWSNYPMDRYVCVDHTAFDRKVETGPLNQRSWVFQERILAPRTIHFAQEQIWWQCRGHLACQSFPSGVPKDSQVLGWQEYSPKGYFDPYMPLFVPLGQLPFAFVRGEDESGYRLWRWVVEGYSQTQADERLRSTRRAGWCHSCHLLQNGLVRERLCRWLLEAESGPWSLVDTAQRQPIPR